MRTAEKIHSSVPSRHATLDDVREWGSLGNLPPFRCAAQADCDLVLQTGHGNPLKRVL